MSVVLTNRIPAIIAQLGPKVHAAVKLGAEAVERSAKSRVPVDQGDLKESIHVESAGRTSYAVIAGNSDVFYGHIVEHGGGNSPAQPFLVPALEENTEEVKGLVVAALRSL